MSFLSPRIRFLLVGACCALSFSIAPIFLCHLAASTTPNTQEQNFEAQILIGCISERREEKKREEKIRGEEKKRKEKRKGDEKEREDKRKGEEKKVKRREKKRRREKRKEEEEQRSCHTSE